MMLRERQSCLWLVSVVLATVALIGCGPSRPATAPVEGTVTLDGQPLAGASVTFTPSAGGRPGMGTTDSSGKFTLMTYEAGDGAVIGQHKVTVIKMTEDAGASGAEPPQETGDEDDEDDEGAEMLMGADTGDDEGDEDLESGWITPQKYSNPDTSGLTIEVKVGMDPVTLTLTSG